MNHDHSMSAGKHLLVMLVCCLIPLALIYGVFAFGITLGSFTPLLPYAFGLLCPLLMFWMMRSMFNEHSRQENAKRENTSLPKDSMVTDI